MKKSKPALFSLAVLAGCNMFAQQIFQGAEAIKICAGSKSITINTQSRVPSFIVFSEDSKLVPSQMQDLLRPALKMQLADGMKSKNVQKDEVGFTHERFTQMYNGVTVDGGEYIAHSKNGLLQTVNGMWFDGITVNTAPSLSSEDAIQKAMSYVNASIYRWQDAQEEAWLKVVQRNPTATYYPSGELVVICKNGDIFKKDYVLAWKLDVFAAQPMSRQWIYVDAHSGEIVHIKNRIHHIDTPASGTTMYSGTQSFTCDNFGSGQYRLREAARGQGIETYDLNNATNTGGAVDFTNATTNWTVTTNDDDAARDAHWGAEGTYDFYLNEMGRNGIDGNGMLMVSYVHYGTAYNNAFWNGTEMTYGDGSQAAGGFNPLTAIDVCGHEFTHGITENSSGLDYQDESGALNESFSDIFGTAIEFYKKPNTANFLIGEEITVNVGSALRSMSNPNQFGDPDCYTGTNWYTGTADNGGVHTNSGVQNYWYYLLSQGGSGTNDLGDPFTVTGIGWYDAARIAFRNNAFYLVNTSQYADARTYAIQSANDLFGACTPEVIATTNAWYACGVGPIYSAAVVSSFSGDVTTSCSVPMTVNFTNTSTNASTAIWDFGDNTTDTSFNSTHTYTTAGTFNVQLISSSACGTNTVVQNSYITVNPPASPVASGANTCNPASMVLNATGTGTLEWFTQPTGGSPVGTGGSYTTPVLNSTTTYYVENSVAQAPVGVGPASTNFGTGGQHNNTSTQYLEFTVFQNCTLATADVNAGSTGNKTFTLWDGAGNQLNQYVVNVASTGVSTVTLNIPLAPGIYRIGGTQMNLYRNNSGAAYPYTANGAVSITGSSAGSAFYYYLYNWNVTLVGCTSTRTPVTVVVGTPNISYSTAAYDTLCTVSSSFALSGGSPLGGTYSGPGVSGNNFDPAVAGPGTHTITYTYVDTAGCTGIATQTVFVDVCSGVSSLVSTTGMVVYPNPSQGDFTLEFVNANNISEAQLVIVNAIGQVIERRTLVCGAGINRWSIDANEYASGFYFINVVAGEESHVRKLEIQ